MTMEGQASSEGNLAAGAPARSYKRRKVVVKRGFQFRYAMVVLALFVLAAFMVWWETFQSLRGLADVGLIRDPQILQLLHDINKVVLTKISIALALVWFLSVLLSHYLAGPIYRIEVGLNALRSGDLIQRMHLRRYDELKPLAVLFNDTLETLRGAVREQRQAVEDAAERLERVALTLQGKERTELADVAKKLRESGGFFKLD